MTTSFKNLQPNETDLVGQWISSSKGVFADKICDRIQYLVDNVLEVIGSDKSGWDTLFRDANDGRYWEKTYPHSEWHGGGPPKLTYIAKEKAKIKYGKKLE